MRGVPARQDVTSLYRLDPTPFTPLKRWESKGTSPLGESARAELSRPSRSSGKPAGEGGLDAQGGADAEDVLEVDGVPVEGPFFQA